MIEEKVVELAIAREKEAKAKSLLAAVNEAIAKQYGNSLAHLSTLAKEAKEAIDRIEGDLRQDATDGWHLSGEKNPHPAISVKEFMVLEYDEGEAIDWCMSSNMKNALKLDKRKFEALAKAAEPEFVTFSVEPRAQIKTDLSEWLE